MAEVGAKDTKHIRTYFSQDVYAMGDNTYGQLGHGNATSTPTPTAVTVMAGQPALKTLSVSMGDSHMLVVTDPGSAVYACGKNEFGQLGLGFGFGLEVRELQPVSALTGKKAVQVSSFELL